MKKVFLLLLILSNFLHPNQVKAAESWVIKDFQSNIILQENGEVGITEAIAVDFSDISKHGIFRDIPYIYQNDDGTKKYTEIKVLSVQRDNKAEKYTTTFTGGYIRIKIGEENVTITGQHEYRISYQAVGVLRGFENYDELYWNTTGNYWEVPIEKASATITLPKAGINQVACYQGLIGSKESCAYTEDSPSLVNFSTTRNLEVGEGLTVAVGYTKGLIPILEGKKPKEITDDLFGIVNLGIFAGVFILGLVGIFTLWLRKGRDYWFQARFINDPNAKQEVRPVTSHETVVVEFMPPENLRPGELGTLLDEAAGNIEVTATLIDLANRNYLTIAEEKKKWLFGSTDYTFKKVNKETESLLQYEVDLLNAIFKDVDEVKLSNLKNKFYKDLPEIKKYLYQNLVDKGFFVENPSSVRTRYILIGVAIGVVGGVFVWLGFMSTLAYFVSFGAAIVLLGIVTMIFSNFMPRKTAQGRAMYVRAIGYKMFVERAEKYRQQFFEKRNLFNEVLPYAIVFGVTEKFAKAFKEMGIEPEKPSWYSGSSTFNAALFGASMTSFSNSFSNTIASTPSGSGSGGGGFSGGGGGGGGGGSW